MKNKINLPRFNAELPISKNSNYKAFAKSIVDNHANTVVLQRKINPLAPIVRHGESCLDNYLNCQLDCNNRYPTTNDSSKNFNSEMRDACIDSCGFGYDACSGSIF
jgi:hypothetical protein